MKESHLEAPCPCLFLCKHEVDIKCGLLEWFAASPAQPSVHQLWSGAALTGLHSFTSLCLWSAQLGGETGLSEGEWLAKPVLTQHLKPPHKYRLPFLISKQPIHLCLHAYTLLHVMCRGVSLKMTTGHLVDPQRGGALMCCSAVQLNSTGANSSERCSSGDRGAWSGPGQFRDSEGV